ncbi:MAG: YfhO family protein [Pyrinomonadaceae bacterium]
MKKSSWPEVWETRRYDLAALAIIVLFFLVFFWPVLSSGKYFITADGFIYSYPLRTAAWNSIRHGQLPLWTPLIMSGYPLLSMAQIGIGYPLTWGYSFLPGPLAEQIYNLAPYILFPVFTYAYAREINRSRLASMFAALGFGYGGAMISSVAYNGMLTNAIMWLPLFLIALERARKGKFSTCLLAATAAYAMSVLTGIGQGFLITGMLALAYGFFLGVAYDKDTGAVYRWLSWERWRPFAVAVSAVILAAGVAAFQILETLQVQRLSIRSRLTYEIFTERSYQPGGLLGSFLAPLHFIVDASAYMAPLAFVLAVAAVVAATRKSQRDPRVWFWLMVAVAAVALMLGKHTPLYLGLYHVPIFNLFRVPARHAFELTFAVGILSAYGWDALNAPAGKTSSWFSRHRTAIALALLVLSVATVVLWRLDVANIPITSEDLAYMRSRFPATRYLGWKFLLTLFTLGLTWVSWRVASTRWRVALLTSVILVACFAEPSLQATRWWWGALKPSNQFTTPSPTTQFLQKYPPEQHRIYTRSFLFVEDLLPQRRFEPTNLTMLHGLQNVAGYEPLILERYSRALGNVFLDAVTTRPGYPADTSLLESKSHVLDILNTSFVVGYAGLSLEPIRWVEKDGIKFGLDNPNVTIKPGETTTLPAVAAEADTLGVVTTLSFSDQIADGGVIAKVRVFTTDGRTIEREIQAGRDSAEWAHDRPDVRARIRHKLAPVFDRHPTSDKGDAFTYYRYWTRIPFGERLPVERIEIINVSNKAFLTIWKATLYDSASRFSMPFPHHDWSKWEPVYDHDDVIILRNRNVLPRVWLVAEAEAVDGEQALRRIQGEGKPFDPSRTALMELPPANLPKLPGGTLSPNATAGLVSYEENRLLVETSADMPTVLVLSEINYPGWEATVDGAIAPIHTTDYLLRGVVLPAGSHRVEMRYTAPAARTGAIISVLTLFLLAVVGASLRGRPFPRARQLKRGGHGVPPLQ